MGAYLSKPVTEKESVSGEHVLGGRRIVYAATAMQGWRVSMEVGRTYVCARVHDRIVVYACNTWDGGDCKLEHRHASDTTHTRLSCAARRTDTLHHTLAVLHHSFSLCTLTSKLEWSGPLHHTCRH